jgi:hypothetical protein
MIGGRETGHEILKKELAERWKYYVCIMKKKLEKIGKKLESEKIKEVCKYGSGKWRID